MFRPQKRDSERVMNVFRSINDAGAWTYNDTYIYICMYIANSFHNVKPLSTLLCYSVLLHCSKSRATATNDKTRYSLGTGISEQMERIAWFVRWEPAKKWEREIGYRQIKRFLATTTTTNSVLVTYSNVSRLLNLRHEMAAERSAEHSALSAVDSSHFLLPWQSFHNFGPDNLRYFNATLLNVHTHDCMSVCVWVMRLCTTVAACCNRFLFEL